MNAKTTWLLLAYSLLCPACSDQADPDGSEGIVDVQHVQEQTGGTGGDTGQGGAAGVGGSSGSAGGGAVGGGGGSEADAQSCLTIRDCTGNPAGGYFECVPPGGSPQQGSGCGAPDWCGQCVCPPMPLAPFGEGTQCAGPSDCPDALSQPGQSSYASICGTMGQCVACSEDNHCAEDQPHCATTAHYFTDCFECMGPTHCPAERPICRIEGASLGATGGTCVGCTLNAECTEGLCQGGTCMPQCDSDSDCAEPAPSCIDRRCSVRPCAADTDCPEHHSCMAGDCLRTPCSPGRSCPAGVCVQGRCHEEPGSCVMHWSVP